MLVLHKLYGCCFRSEWCWCVLMWIKGTSSSTISRFSCTFVGGFFCKASTDLCTSLNWVFVCCFLVIACVVTLVLFCLFVCRCDRLQLHSLDVLWFFWGDRLQLHSLDCFFWGWLWFFWGDRLQLHSLDGFFGVVLCDVWGDRLQLHSLDGLFVWLWFWWGDRLQLHSLDGFFFGGGCVFWGYRLQLHSLDGFFVGGGCDFFEVIVSSSTASMVLCVVLWFFFGVIVSSSTASMVYLCVFFEVIVSSSTASMVYSPDCFCVWLCVCWGDRLQLHSLDGFFVWFWCLGVCVCVSMSVPPASLQSNDWGFVWS